MDNIERRYFSPEIEARSSDNGDMVVSGYSAVFDVRSDDLGWFTEQIDKRAFDGVLSESDVVCLFNHNENQILGRESNGTLKLSVDGRGLHMENTLPKTTLGKDIDLLVQRKDIKHQSFGFVVGEDKWETVDGKEVRTILNIKKLVDVSLVTYPAYPDTDVAKRSLSQSKTSANVGNNDEIVKENEDIDIELTLNRLGEK